MADKQVYLRGVPNFPSCLLKQLFDLSEGLVAVRETEMFLDPEEPQPQRNLFIEDQPQQSDEQLGLFDAVGRASA